MDINPPLVSLLMVIVVFLSNILGISSLVMFKASVILVSFLSLVFIEWINRFHRIDKDNTISFFVFLMVIVALFSSYYTLGQREHVTVILILPYLFVSAGRARGERTPLAMSITTGILAGIGYAMKPFFLLPFAVNEFYLYRKTRKAAYTDPAPMVILAIQVIYFLSILLFYREYFDVARVLIRYYEGLNRPLTQLLTAKESILFYAAIIAFFWYDRYIKKSEILRIFAIANLMFFVTMLMQHKGWHNHLYPQRFFSMVILAVVGYDLFELFAASWFRVRRSLVLAIAVAVLFLYIGKKLSGVFPPEGNNIRNSYQDVINYVKDKAEGQYIFVMSATLQAGFPLVNYSHTLWASRYTHLWILPGIYKNKSFRDARELYAGVGDNPDEYTFARNVITDLWRYLPKLILIDRRRELYNLLPERFDYIEYFLHYEGFRDLWKRYRFRKEIGGFTIFERAR